MNFSTGLCHLIHEYDLIMTSNVGMMSISFYVMMRGGGGGSKDPLGGRTKTKPGRRRVNGQRVPILTQKKAFV